MRLQVRDASGQSGTVAETIQVAARPLTLMQPFPIVRIAGPVENTPSLVPGSSSTSKWALYASHARTAPRNAPRNSPMR